MNYQNLGYRWLKAQKKYRNLQRRLSSTTDTNLVNNILEKIERIKKRILNMNRKWKLGVATSFLLAWLAANPAQAQFASPFEIDSLDSTTGFTINGINQDERLGSSVKIIKDINGDGIDDLLISANGNDYGSNLLDGKAFIVFGKSTGFGGSFDLANLDGSNGFTVTGIQSTPNNGISLTGLDDINGDGFGDFAIGAYRADSVVAYSKGQTYVIFGNNTGFAPTLDVSAINGTNGFLINGQNSDRIGRSLAQADLNGDGFSDIIIGAPNVYIAPYSQVGKTYVVFGKSASFGPLFNLNTLNGTNGLTIYGSLANSSTGITIDNLNDFNGDGIDDIILDAGGISESYIVFGNSTLFPDSLNVAALDGTNGLTINGFTYSGGGNVYTAAGAGDINGDGLGDIIIGAPNNQASNDNTKGKSFIVLGSNTPFSATFDISTLNGTNGFLIESAQNNDRLGKPIGSVGDVNGDTIDDFFVGNDYSEDPQYIVFGKTTGFGDTLSLSTINGKTGVDFNFDNKNRIASFHGGGDINGDGIDDIIFGSSYYSNNTGKAFIVFGDDTPDTTAPLVASYKPLNGATNISKSNNLFINFNERINKGTGNIIIYKASDDSVVETIDVNSINVVTNIKSLTINPTDQLGDGQDYYIQIDATALQDAWGNAFAGIGDKTTWNFKTVAAGETASELSISTIDGTNGFSLLSTGLYADAYTAVSNAGDFNGDGLDDFIIGHPYAYVGDSTNGEAYVVFGNSAGFTSPFDLNALDGVNGLKITGFPINTQAGYNVSNAGDVNGDGIDDVLIGTSIQWQDTTNNYGGRVYVVFGSVAGFTSPFDINSLNGSNGFVIDRLETTITGNSYGGQRFEFKVGGGLDLNNDGVDDMIIGAPRSSSNGLNYSGKTYVIFGSSSGFSSSFDASTLNGTNGFSIDGLATNGNLGNAVSNAGDMNGDGIDDLAIAAYRTDPSGEVYVIFGNASGFGTSFDLSTLDGTNGFTMKGDVNNVTTYDSFGVSVSNAGDINGDGVGDLIVGAFYGSTASGSAYIVFGKTTPFSALLDMSTLDGTNGFEINGKNIEDYAGISVSGVGDVNGDGVDDIIVGAPGVDVNGVPYSGEAYVIFGTDTPFGASFDPATLDGTNGFVIAGEKKYDYIGYKVSGAGDINGDGADDIISGGYYGGTHIIFGVAAQTEIGGVAAQDYNALIDLYNTTDGANWANNTNWNTAANVDTWFGVTVANARVTGIDLSDNDGGTDGSTTDGNNLTGTVSSQLADISELIELNLGNNAITGAIPSSVGTLANLVSLDISNNSFTDLADLSALPSITALEVTLNNFTFEDIEPNVSITGIVYSPQKLVPAPADLNLDEGQELKISVAVGGAANQYQWVKDNVDIGGATADSLVVASATAADNGTYFLSTMNTNVSGLTLQSEDVVVTVTLDTIQGVRTAHYNALLDLYNDAGGSDWVDKTNWSTAEQVSAWFGITTVDVDVTEIRLPSNNLQGSVPASLTNITSLTVLDLQDNFIETLPDLTGLANLDTLNVAENNLDFTSLEINAGIAGITYGDQEPTTQVPVDTTVYVGQPYELIATVPGNFNSYQWYKDSVLMAGETNDTLSIGVLNRASMGIFYAEIINSAVPDLIISSSVNSVLAGADITGLVKDTNDRILDEGKVSLFKVNQGAAFDTTAIFELVPGNGGVFNFPKTVLADYIFLANIDTIAFDDVLPTYWSSTIFWEEADTLLLNDNNTSIEILAAATPPDDPGGNGLIFGSVFEDLPASGRIAARRKLPKASVSARKKRASSRGAEDTPIFDLVGYVITDENGDYSIDGLTPGIYRFNVQYPGIPMDTVNSNIDIEVTENGAKQTNQVVATVTEDGIILETSPLGIYINDYLHKAELYPVPSNTSIFIKLDQYRNTDVIISVRTLTGKLISTETKTLRPDNPAPLELDVSYLESGVYIVEVITTRTFGVAPLKWRTRFVKSD